MFPAFGSAENHKTTDVAVIWLKWDSDVFKQAKKEDKPILLYISAVWCMNCHILEARVFGNAKIVDYINKHFIPVRVDADDRPDIAERYVVRGLPTFSFLMPDGKVIVQGNNIPPHIFKKNMQKVLSLYKNKRDKIIQAIAKREAKKKTVSSTSINVKDKFGQGFVNDIDSLLKKEFDSVNGGYGEAAKFPLPYNADFELMRYYLTDDESYLARVNKTLSGINNGLLDSIEGGFYRYSVSADWQSPHYEKMLAVNASIINIFLDGFRLTGDEIYKTSILKTLAYIERELFDQRTGAYFSSQDAEDGSYYKLDKVGRSKRKPPSVDHRAYSAANAQLGLTFVNVWSALRDEQYLSKAKLIFIAINKHFIQSDGLTAHSLDGSERFLEDQIWSSLLAVKLYEVTGENQYLDSANKLAGNILKWFWDEESSGFLSFNPDKALSAYNQRVKSRETNGKAAELYWRLFYLTGNKRYQDIMKQSLAIFPEVTNGTDYISNLADPMLAVMIERINRHPVEIRIVQGNQATSVNELLMEIVHRYGPLTIIEILNHSEDNKRLEALGYPQETENMAYLCVEEVCLPAGINKINKAFDTIEKIIRE